MAEVKLEDIQEFIEAILELDDKAIEGQQKLESLSNGPRGIIRAIKMGVIMALQKDRIKKLTIMKAELVARSKAENWDLILGFKEYVKSVEDKFLPGRV